MAVRVNRQRERLRQHPGNSLGCLCIVEGSKRSLILNGATWKTVDDAGWRAFCVEVIYPVAKGQGCTTAQDKLDLRQGVGGVGAGWGYS